MRRSVFFSSSRRLTTTLCLALACTAGGCANMDQSQHHNAEEPKQTAQCDCAKTDAARKKVDGLSEQRVILSEGYSLLYKDASHLDLTKVILYGKSESDSMKKIVTDVADFGGKVEKDLERIAKEYPGVLIDLDPLPVMEKRKRWDIGKDRVIDFAPGVGKGGREYERTVLIALLNGINHERHMCKVMAEEEPEASLKKFLVDTQKGYDGFYDRVEALLNKEYFRN